MEDIDGLSDQDLALIRQLMPMGADSEDYDSSDDGNEADRSDEQADENDGNVEEFDEVGDGFPESKESDVDGKTEEEYSHTEL